MDKTHGQQTAEKQRISGKNFFRLQSEGREQICYEHIQLQIVTISLNRILEKKREEKIHKRKEIKKRKLLFLFLFTAENRSRLQLFRVSSEHPKGGELPQTNCEDQRETTRHTHTQTHRYGRRQPPPPALHWLILTTELSTHTPTN